MFGFGKKKAPEKIELKSATLLSSILSGQKSGVIKCENIDKDGYARNAIVWACINRIAESAADIPIIFMKGDEPLDMDSDNPVVELLECPNILTSYKEFIYQSLAYYLLYGESYHYVAGKESLDDRNNPTELLCIHPNEIEVIRDHKEYFPSGYRWSCERQKIFPIDRVTGLSQMLHFHNFNPSQYFCGMSPLNPLTASIEAYNDGMSWNASLLENGARPDGAMSTKEMLTEEQFERLREQVDNMVAGQENAGRPLLLENGLEWQQYSMTPRDMDFEGTINNMARAIAAVYKVPPQLLNIPDADTYNNMSEARVSFYQHTVIPLLSSFLSHIERSLFPLFSESDYMGLSIKLDLDNVPALQSVRDTEFQKLQEATFLTVNEKRKYIGLESIDGGDDLYIDANKIPVSLVGESIGEVE